MIDGGLLHVVGLDAVVDVLVRVVGPGVVLDLVLDELEAGQADAVERLVVGAAGVARAISVVAPISRNGWSHLRKIGRTASLPWR